MNSNGKTLSYKEDLVTKELLPIKILLFLQTAGDMALFPFLTLHLKSLGMSLTEIGIQFAISPIATLIGTPLVGIVADKIGNFQRMLSLSLIVCAILAYSLLFIPAIKSESLCNINNESITLTCPQYEVSSQKNLTINLPDCLEKSKDNKYFRNKKQNNKPKLINLNECRVDCSNNDVMCLQASNSTELCINHIIFNGSANIIDSNSQSILISLINVMTNEMAYESIYCKQKDVCIIRCPVMANTISNYIHKRVVDQKSRQLTFWLYMLLRILLFVVIVAEISLLKAAILTIVGKCKSEYGYQRFWSSIAMVIIPPVTGILMDYQQHNSGNSFAICFQIYAAFKIFMAFVSLFMNLNVKAPSLQVWRKVTQLFRNSEVTILLLFVTFMGSTWGFIETFIVWYLEELGASRSLIGVSIALGAASGIPIAVFAGSIERKFGHIPVLVFGLLVYAIRLIGYSYSSDVYNVLIYETLEGITSSLVIIIITTYSTILSTSELIATMQATWASLHYSVGRAIGSGIGGYLMDRFGSQNAYRIYAAFCLLAAAFYLFIYLFWLRHNVKRRQQAEETKNRENKVSTLELSNHKEPNNHNNGLENPSYIKSE